MHSKLFKQMKQIIKKTFFKSRILKKEIIRLQYQLNYLKNHTNPETLKPAIGFIREYQMKEIYFMKEIITLLNNENIFPTLGGGGILGLIRHNGFVPWDDDLDFDLLREDFDRIVDYAKKNWVWIELDFVGDYLYKSYDDAIRKNPGKIIAIQSPYCLHIYKGQTLIDSVNVEFFILDYVKENVSDEQIIQYKNKFKSYLKKDKRNVKEILSFYEQELNNSSIFTREKTDRLYYGIGNHGFTEYSFHGFLNYSDVFPIREVEFEGAIVKIPNKPENYLNSLYGDWKKLPNDVGIPHTFEDINNYCREYNLEEIDYYEKW